MTNNTKYIIKCCDNTNCIVANFYIFNSIEERLEYFKNNFVNPSKKISKFIDYITYINEHDNKLYSQWLFFKDKKNLLFSDEEYTYNLLFPNDSKNKYPTSLNELYEYINSNSNYDLRLYRDSRCELSFNFYKWNNVNKNIIQEIEYSPEWYVDKDDNVYNFEYIKKNYNIDPTSDIDKYNEDELLSYYRFNDSITLINKNTQYHERFMCFHCQEGIVQYL
jgi:hypothetical protein